MFQKILVPLDRADDYHAVLDQAVYLATMTGGQLLLLHVLYPFDPNYPHPLYPSIDAYPALQDEAILAYTEQLQRFEQEGVNWLRSLTQQATNQGIAAEYAQSPGEPGKTICEMARTWQADTIVMGRRGHRGIEEMLLGSVSNYVTHHAPCSVLVVQGILTEAQALQEYLDVC
jgi:nucleotide-binding universal stress UspA family protein